MDHTILVAGPFHAIVRASFKAGDASRVLRYFLHIHPYFSLLAKIMSLVYRGIELVKFPA